MIFVCVVLAEVVVRVAIRIRPDKNILREYVLWHSSGESKWGWVNEAASYVRFRPNRQTEDLNSYGFHSPEG